MAEEKVASPAITPAVSTGTPTTAVAVAKQPSPAQIEAAAYRRNMQEGIEVAADAVSPKSMAELITYCEMLSTSTLVPESYRQKPANLMLVETV